jgi:ribonuclease E
MLIDATHPEETRVAVISGNKLEEYDFETIIRKELKGNIYLVKVTRVEPSLQAAFVDFGGNRHGFLPFPEIHPDYYRIPIADREALIAEERAIALAQAAKEDAEDAAELAAAGLSLDDDNQIIEDTEDKEGVQLVDLEDILPEDAGAGAESAEDDAAEEAFTPKHRGSLAADMGADADSVLEDNNDEDEEEDAEGDTAASDEEKNPEVEMLGGDSVETPVFRSSIKRRYKIQEVIKRNQIMLIQIGKEERGNKGAAVTSYISLPGRYCVLMPNSPRGGGVSRKVSNIKDRQRLKKILYDLNVPEGMSVILRTAGVSRSQAEIKRDLDYLLRLWDQIREFTLKSTAPALIYEEGNLIKRAIRDLYKRDIDEVHVAGEEAYKHAKDFMHTLMPSHSTRVHLYQDEAVPLFSRYQVEAQIDEIHNPTVHLKSGGYIVINPTEALVSIDVNSGKATKGRHIEETAMKTNLEAADEIARQLRLRDQGGLVVVDFIDMEEPRNNRLVERRMAVAMQHDRARIQLGRISSFGLLELSRQRLHPSLVETNFEICKHCAGTGLTRTIETTAVIVLRAIQEEGMKGRAAEIKVSVPSEVALYIFNHKRDMLTAIEKRHNIQVFIHADNALIKPAYTIDVIRAAGTPRFDRAANRPAPVQTVDISDLPEFTEADIDDRGDDEDGRSFSVEDEVSFVESEPRHSRPQRQSRPSRGGGRHNNKPRDDHRTAGTAEHNIHQDKMPQPVIPRAPRPPQSESAVLAEGEEGTVADGTERNPNRRRGRRGGRNRGRGRDGRPFNRDENAAQPAGNSDSSAGGEGGNASTANHDHAPSFHQRTVNAPAPDHGQQQVAEGGNNHHHHHSDDGEGGDPSQRKGWWKRLTE